MRLVAAIALSATLVGACTETKDPASANASPATTSSKFTPITPVGVRPIPKPTGLVETWVGDLDGIRKRGLLRVLVAPSRTHFERVKGGFRGTAVDVAAALEKEFNRDGLSKVTVTFVETTHERLIPDLLAGKGDVAANLMWTFDRDERVDFAEPLIKDVRELVVTGPGETPLVSLEDVGGRTIYVRRNSDHHTSLLRLNEQLEKSDRLPARIVIDTTAKTDEELLDRVNQGRIPAALADDYVFNSWRARFGQVAANPDIAVSQDGELAWVTRKDSPALLRMLNEFFSTHRLPS
jgi:ABC-type amino acid transport substrate-binding protein